MDKAYLLKKLAICITILAVVNFIAVYLNWYYFVWWFDMPMHFLGGLTVFYFGAIVWRFALKYVSFGRYLYESILTAVLIGVLWEALEFYLYIKYGSPMFSLVDSFSDVFFDLSGALLGAFLITGFRNQKI